MFWEFIVPLVIVLVICYFSIPKFKYGVDCQINKTHYLIYELTSDNVNSESNAEPNRSLKRKKSKKLKNITPEMRADTCFITKDWIHVL